MLDSAARRDIMELCFAVLDTPKPQERIHHVLLTVAGFAHDAHDAELTPPVAASLVRALAVREKVARDLAVQLFALCRPNAHSALCAFK